MEYILPVPYFDSDNYLVQTHSPRARQVVMGIVLIFVSTIGAAFFRHEPKKLVTLHLGWLLAYPYINKTNQPDSQINKHEQRSAVYTAP